MIADIITALAAGWLVLVFVVGFIAITWAVFGRRQVWENHHDRQTEKASWPTS